MKKSTYLIISLLIVGIFIIGFSQIDNGPRDEVTSSDLNNPTNTLDFANSTGRVVLTSETDNLAILADSSQLISHPGQGFGGADASAITTPGTLYGYGNNGALSYWMGDDFVVPAGFKWKIDSIKFFTYQTGSTTTSTITGSKLAIFTGNNSNPDSTGSSFAAGDTVTSRLKSTYFTNIYRVTNTALTGNTRPIMAVVDTLSKELMPGTYWLAFNFTGSLASGPWAPPRTILGQPATGNSKQKQPGVGWVNGVDGANPQGIPFVIYGSAIPLTPAGYFNNFESYTVGQRLACQDSLNWTTWSITPCNTTEDPLISNAQSFSPTKSVVITQNNDLVKRLNNDSTGVHEISMKFYVPTGKAGYWNTLAVFSGTTSKWGMECYFDVTETGNNGRLFGGSSVAVPFAYTHGAWQTAKLLVNLDVDSAKFFINGTMVNKWKWTLGANGTAVPKKLGGNDFFGATATDEMYMDDYSYMPGANWITGITQNGNTVPVEYTLSQNYPNPFNPTTKINFALPKSGLVTMKIYDILGKEVATLVNEVKNAGSYTVDFNASNLTSGVYFYKVSVNGFSEVKKMLLLK